jgi:hypothetical protein
MPTKPTPSCAPPVVLLALALAAALPAALAGAQTYGAGVALAEPTPLAAVLADPEAWAGKRVRIEGRVAEVCPKAGCWMELVEEAGGHRLRVKVDDGVIVFPADAVGRLAAAEGVVEVLPMSRESYRAWLAHLAEEQGRPFDEAEVGAGPFRLVQVRGAGAEVRAE